MALSASPPNVVPKPGSMAVPSAKVCPEGVEDISFSGPMTTDITWPNSVLSRGAADSFLGPKSFGALLEARLAVSVRAKVMGVASGQGFHGWIWRRRSGHFLPFAPVIT